MSKQVIAFILIIFLALVETSFLRLLPEPISYIPLVLICSIFMIQYRSSVIGIWWLFGFGLYLDLMGIGVIPFESLLLLTVGYVTWLVSQRLFTNRSLYGILSSGLFAFTLITIFHHILSLSLPGGYIFWQLLWLFVFLYLLFQFASKVSKYAL